MTNPLSALLRYAKANLALVRIQLALDAEENHPRAYEDVWAASADIDPVDIRVDEINGLVNAALALRSPGYLERRIAIMEQEAGSESST